MKYIASIIILFAFTIGLNAQPVNKSSTDQLIEAAELALEYKDYYNALENYQKYYKEERDIDVAYKVATLHYKLRDYAKAETWFSRIAKRKNTRRFKNTYVPEVKFEEALMMKYNGKYTEAKEAFQLYIGEAEDIERIKAAKKEIAGCELALEMDEASGISVVNAGKKVNSRYSEASPVLVNGNELYYAGIKSNKIVGLEDDAEGVVSEIFKAPKTEDGFGKPVALKGDNIPREGYHLGNLTITPDGERMYFTRAELDGNDLSASQIYVSQMGADGWGPANLVEGINGAYIVRHPALGELFNQEVIIFSSNKDGGFGGYDLYYSTRTGDGFSSPTNMGELINGPMDEVTPYYIDGTLYFSSDSYISMGGFDVYNSIWNGSTWSKPENIGKPYNSSVDDLYFSIDDEGYQGLIVSNREGTSSVKGKTCCDDIWIVSKEKIILDLVTSNFNEKKQPLDSVKVVVTEMIDGKIGEKRSRMKPDSSVYSFPLLVEKSYQIIASRKGFISDTATVNTVGLTQSQLLNQAFYLKSLPPPPPTEPEEIYEEYTINEAIRLNNIYYDYDDDKILADAEPDLEVILELMAEYPTMVIELGSHTDARGPTPYNRDLSQRRADSARKWLLKRKIAAERIQAKGYGESVILNHCTNGVKCSDDEHRFNRRTEFKIVAGPTTIKINKKRLIKRSSN